MAPSGKNGVRGTTLETRPGLGTHQGASRPAVPMSRATVGREPDRPILPLAEPTSGRRSPDSGDEGSSRELGQFQLAPARP